MARRILLGAATVAALMTLGGVAAADTAPVDPNEPRTVSADPLPTAQINGVAWAQAEVNNKVYVGGSFSSVRPSGAAPGTNTSPRSNLMAYDIRTGVADPSFRPVLNGQVLTMALSPDKKTLYVGGDFTTVNGQWRVHLAAFDTATGALRTNFHPVVGSTVRAITASPSTVYFGGDFTSVANAVGGATLSRPYLAAASATTGAILAWSPRANAPVTAMAVNYDRSKVVVGGRFTTLGGKAWYGMGAVHPVNGAPLPWAATAVLRNAGQSASWTSLRSTPNGVYGTGYVFGSGGNFEGTFRADNTTGQIGWMADCHGDHYTAFPHRGVVYTTSHAHYCGNLGGFPQTDPWSVYWADALEDRASTTLLPDIFSDYTSFAGRPAPRQLPWYPTFLPGTYTTSKQAGWSIEGNLQYISVVGEFIAVNGGGQQGLVRFAVPGVAPNKVKPNLNPGLTPALSSHTPGEVRVGWLATHDRDNRAITYKVFRNFTSINDTPVHQVTVNSRFWQRRPISFTDKGRTPGQTVQYRVAAFDPNGNYVLGDPAGVVVTGTTAGLTYRRAVFADAPSAYFPLDTVPADRRLQDLAGSDTSVSAGGVSPSATGALLNSGKGAATFNGVAATGYAAGEVSQPAPDTFTVEAWVKTVSNNGGRIVGYSSRSTGGASTTRTSAADRHLYMDNSGRVHFGVESGGKRVVSTFGSFNDGQWHQVVGSLGPNGMRLLVDGKFVGSREDVTSGRRYSGQWRIGGDTLAGWPNAPSNHYLNGSVDEVAVYPVELTRKQVDAHYVASGRTSRLGTAPADAYGAAVHQGDPELYWRMETTSGTTAVDSGPADTRGAITGGVTMGQPGALSPSAGRAFAFNGTNGAIVATRGAVNPRRFTVGVWFKATTTRGGKLIGFGNAASGLSTSYDRHLYLRNDGRVVFGVFNGQQRTLVSPQALNDGSWHMVVGTLGANGMRLYVDGRQVGSNGVTTATGYAGHWRVGGDRTWGSTSNYFHGVLDEAMVFSRALSAWDVGLLHQLARG